MPIRKALGKAISKGIGKPWVFPPVDSGGVSVVFDALTPNDNFLMVGVLKGVGNLTTTRATVQMFQDHEGVYRTAAVNEPAWKGGRQVVNVLTFSEAFDNAVWTTLSTAVITTGVTDPDGGSTACTITATGGTNQKLRHDNMSGALDYGPAITSVWLKRVSGTGAISICDADDNFSFDVSGSLTTEWQRFTVSLAGGAITARFYVNVAVENDAVSVAWPMIESASGRTDTTTPSEYCANDGVTANTGRAVYGNENGNSVLGYIVTEATGSELTTLPAVQVDKSLTNEIFQSRDLSVTWTENLTTTPASYNQVGLSGQPNTATLLTDDNATDWSVIFQSKNVAISTTNVVEYFIKKDTDETRFPAFGMGHGSFVANRYLVSLNTKTGATHVLTALSGAVHEIKEEPSGWWRLTLQAPNPIAGTTALFAVIYAAAGQVLTSSIANAVGSIIIGGTAIFKETLIPEIRNSGPIVTTTAAVTTGVAIHGFDLLNHNQKQGAYVFDWTPSYDEPENTIAQFLLALRGSSTVAYINAGSNVVSTYDGTSGTSVANNYVAGTTYRISVVYDDDASDPKHRIGCNALDSADAVYDGDYLISLALLEVLYQADYTGTISRVRRAEGGTYDELVAWATEQRGLL